MRGIPGREREELWICPEAKECNHILNNGDECGHWGKHEHKDGCEARCSHNGEHSTCIRYIPEPTCPGCGHPVSEHITEGTQWGVQHNWNEIEKRLK